MIIKFYALVQLIILLGIIFFMKLSKKHPQMFCWFAIFFFFLMFMQIAPAYSFIVFYGKAYGHIIDFILAAFHTTMAVWGLFNLILLRIARLRSKLQSGAGKYIGNPSVKDDVNGDTLRR